MEKRRAVVIGAGLGGLSAASMLAKKGIPVLVIEQSGGPGGRARVITKDGFTLEYGVHSYRYAEQSAAQEIMARLGVMPEWIKETHANFLIKGKDLVPLSGRARQTSELAQKYFPKEEVETLRQVMAKMVMDQPEKWFRKPVSEYMGKLLADEKVLLLAKLICFQVMEPDPAKCSAGELIVHLRRSLEAGVPAAQMRGSSKALIDRMVSAVLDAGGEIKYRDRALALSIEKGRVISADTSEGELEAEAFIYAAPIQQFFKIAPAEAFPEKWMRRARKLEPVSGVAIDFALRETLSDLKGWMVEPELGIMGKFPSNLDPSLAPEGKQLSSWLITMPREKVNDPEATRLSIHKLRSQIKRVFPDFFGLTEWERILVLPVVDGAALTIKQSVLDRPGIAAPGIANLFFAGDCVAAPGASGEIALRSGMEAAEKCAAFLGGVAAEAPGA